MFHHLPFIFRELSTGFMTSNTKGATSGAGTANPSSTPEVTPGCNFIGVRVAQSLLFSILHWRPLFVFLSFLPLDCLSFFVLWLLITPLVSWNHSCTLNQSPFCFKYANHNKKTYHSKLHSLKDKNPHMCEAVSVWKMNSSVRNHRYSPWTDHHFRQTVLLAVSPCALLSLWDLPVFHLKDYISQYI